MRKKYKMLCKISKRQIKKRGQNPLFSYYQFFYYEKRTGVRTT